MKALCWMKAADVKVENVPDPILLSPTDIIVKVSSTAICGSDLHLFNGNIPSMKEYDIMGHEFMGEVVETGAAVKNLRVGDRVLMPFEIACGKCWYCQQQLWSACDNSNPNAGPMEKLMGEPGSGLYGYSHIYGGYDGGQAQYVRVPFADVNAVKIENDFPDEKLLFLTDIFPTGYQAAKQANVGPGQVVAVWGCGPVGLFSIASSFLLGAEKVIAIDHVDERLAMAKGLGAETINFNAHNADMMDELQMATGGRGPDVCIDAVGFEAFGHGIIPVIDQVKQTLKVTTDRPNVLRECIQACRKGGVVSVPGVYSGTSDMLNFGVAFGKGLTFKMGQTHVKQHLPELLRAVEEDKIEPSFLITHIRPLDDAPDMYTTFRDKKDGCIKVVLKPFA